MIDTVKTTLSIVRSLFRMGRNERALVMHYIERIEATRDAA